MIKKLQAGDNSIPASGWNEMRAFVNDYSFPQYTFKSPPRNPAYIYVKNVTSAALPALSIVKISTPIYTRTGDTFRDKGVEYGVEFNVATPDSDSNIIAVTQETIRPGCIGRAIADGLTPCFINVATSGSYKYAKPKLGYYEYLEPSENVTNIQIVWIASGTGTKEAVVRLTANDSQFFASVTVTGATGGANAVYATINGTQYEVIFPNANAGLSAPNFPDIYPGDEILVLVDLETGNCYGVDYPTDYENGTLMAFYSGQGSPGRGWDALSTSQAMSDAGFTLYQKVKTNAIL